MEQESNSRENPIEPDIPAEARAGIGLSRPPGIKPMQDTENLSLIKKLFQNCT